MQNEITQQSALLDDNGDLIQKGYARHPILQFNPENIQVSSSAFMTRLRLKQWDYYAVTTPDDFFSVCISNIGYMGLVFAYHIDFDTNTFTDNFAVTPFGKGCDMPLQSDKGDLHFIKKKIKISFVKEKETRRLEVDWQKFSKGNDLSARLKISQPKDHENIVMATPIKKGYFYYNHKVNAMPTKGYFSIGNRISNIEPKSALACLDWGRGVWPYSTFWIWSNASGFLPDKRTFGLNMGCGFGDLSAATENCFFINGKMTKVNQVDIRYNPKNTMEPWTFNSDDKKIDLTLTPFFHRKSNMNFLILKSKVNQMFGRYDGQVIDDQGQIHKIKNLIGWSEDHRARW